MPPTSPFGDLAQSHIMIIGHDPRLQRSLAEAEFPFFLDYLLRPYPGRINERSKYNLANAMLGYISNLAGKEIPLASLFVTNLCNEFLPPTQGRGTVLIPDYQAEKGVADIRQTVAQGHFQLILPLSLQVSYHLGRLNFFDEREERIQTFVQQAQPKPQKTTQGIYTPIGDAPFLEMCGRRFHHHGIPVVPILHIKAWSLNGQTGKYHHPMQQAAQEIRRALEV